MKNKIIPIILITLFTLTSKVNAFSDTENHWAKDSIEKFNQYDIVKGYENDLFKPDSYITRAETVTIINRMNGVTKESNKYIPDITRQDWYYTEIRKAVQSKVMQGDEEGYTNPNYYITREEAIVMLSRAFAIENVVDLKNNFEDKKEISSWAKKAVDTFVMYNYVNGYEDNTIRPKENITRAELVTIINRIYTEIATSGIYEGNISGNMIVMGKNVVLSNLVVNGNLMISEGTKETITLNNVEVKGDLILREEFSIEEILCNGRKVLLYLENDNTFHKYKNEEYGIEFSISSDVKVLEKWNETKIDYEEEDLIIIEVKKSDEYYLKNINTIAKEEIRKVDNLYNLTENGEINNIEYILYADVSRKGNNNFLVIKRDNLVYTILFNKISANNLVDNVIGTLNFFETDFIQDRKNVIYKNNKLNLKFSYKEDYVGVDDSYNTNIIYSGDAPLKLFIQVNSITDIQNYEFEEVIYLLKTLARKEGELKKTETFNVTNKKAVRFEIDSEEKLIYSIYIVDGNILYNFVFRADEEVMKEIGEELINDIIGSLEI